jgi:hypothetical protein
MMASLVEAAETRALYAWERLPLGSVGSAWDCVPPVELLERAALPRDRRLL